MTATNEPESVGADFPIQQARCRELLDLYRSIPTGWFAAFMVEQALKHADEAMASGDIIEILAAYQEMTELK